MKKRLLAGFLSLVLVLSLLPTAALAGLETAAAGAEDTAAQSAVSTTGTGVAGVANVYTLADIKAATNDSSVTTIRLMNDIDAGKENVSYYRSNDYTTVTDTLWNRMTLDGQGHTIYNLKTTLLRYNEGTIKNLNTTIHDTPEDSEHLSLKSSQSTTPARRAISVDLLWRIAA